MQRRFQNIPACTLGQAFCGCSIGISCGMCAELADRRPVRHYEVFKGIASCTSEGTTLTPPPCVVELRGRARPPCNGINKLRGAQGTEEECREIRMGMRWPVPAAAASELLQRNGRLLITRRARPAAGAPAARTLGPATEVAPVKTLVILSPASCLRSKSQCRREVTERTSLFPLGVAAGLRANRAGERSPFAGY